MGDMYDGVAAALMSQPFFSKLSILNSGGVCATTRLLQLKSHGIYSVVHPLKNSVARYASEAGAGEMTVWPWMVKVFDSVPKLAKAGELEEYNPVLSRWEVIRGGASEMEEMGYAVFSDLTARKFFIVDPSEHPCIHCLMNTKRRANLFYCLLKYLGYRPVFVKYISLSISQTDLLRAFMDGVYENGFTSLTNREPSPSQLWGLIDATNYQPALPSLCIDMIDTFLNGDDFALSIVTEGRVRDGLSQADAVRLCQGAFRVDFPNAPAMMDDEATSRVQRWCQNCKWTDSSNGKELSRCGRCRMVFYCSRECQRAQWSFHKTFCKKSIA